MTRFADEIIFGPYAVLAIVFGKLFLQSKHLLDKFLLFAGGVVHFRAPLNMEINRIITKIPGGIRLWG